jgi:hypothetical protein
MTAPYDTRTIVEMLAVLSCDSRKFLKDFPADSSIAQNATQAEQLFTSAVDVLRHSNSPIISDLMSYVWDVFHYRHILMAIGPRVKSITFAAARKKDGTIQGLIFLPPNWPEMVKADPVMQMGAVLFTGSQVSDFYNGLIISKEEQALVLYRARSYEAEYLLLLHNGGIPLNEYQQQVLTENPTGFNPALAYSRKPVALTS